MTVCTGTRLDGVHCCFLEGTLCPHYGGGCTLRAELGSWDKVHVDPRYVRDVQPMWDRDPYPGGSCGDFPQNMPGYTGGKCCWAGEL